MKDVIEKLLLQGKNRDEICKQLGISSARFEFELSSTHHTAQSVRNVEKRDDLVDTALKVGGGFLLSGFLFGDGD